VTYWDTAAGYNGGKSEGGIGMYLEKILKPAGIFSW